LLNIGEVKQTCLPAGRSSPAYASTVAKAMADKKASDGQARSQIWFYPHTKNFGVGVYGSSVSQLVQSSYSRHSPPHLCIGVGAWLAPLDNLYLTGRATPVVEPRRTASCLRGKRRHYGAGKGNPAFARGYGRAGTWETCRQAGQGLQVFVLGQQSFHPVR